MPLTGAILVRPFNLPPRPAGAPPVSGGNVPADRRAIVNYFLKIRRRIWFRFLNKGQVA